MDAGSSVPEAEDTSTFTAKMNAVTQERLRELEASTPYSTSRIVERAILALYRSWICDPLDPKPNTGIPFKKRWSDNDAHVVLRQLDGKTFRMAEGFRYQVEGEDKHVVRPHWATDLASVPGFLTWLISRYGRHSLPVLLHDCLIEENMEAYKRKEADDVLRDSMDKTEVPFVRRWMMWAGVSLFSQSKGSWARKALIGLWLASYFLAALALFVPPLGRWLAPFPTSFRVLAVLVSPLLLSVLWWKRYLIGMISAYTVLLIAAPSTAIFVTLLLYAGVERAVALVLPLLGRSDKVHPLFVKNSKADKTPEGGKGEESCLE